MTEKPARNPRLRPADDLVVPALARTLRALDPPDEDAAVVKLAEVVAQALDRMNDSQRTAMAGQTVPQLLKLLQELDARARRRGQRPSRAPGALEALRGARVSGKRP